MDPKYEFNCPVYVDFEAVLDGTEGEEDVDHWFSHHDINFDMGTNKQGTFPSGFTTTVKEEPAECTEPVKADSPKDAEPVSELVKRERECEDSATVTAPPAKLGQKRSFAIASLQTPVPKLPRVQRDSSKKAADSIRKILKPSENHRAVTAKTPEHLRRYLTKKQSQVKRTREELDTEKMQKMQEEARKKLREYRKSFHRLADSAKKPKVVKYSKPTTESVGFEFRTDRRLRKRRAESAQHPSHSSVAHPNTFPMTLRSASNTSVVVEDPMHKKCTEVKPFNFHLESRMPRREAVRRREEGEEAEGEKGEYIPTAEYILKFHSGVPERFRSLPRKTLRSVSASVDADTTGCSNVTASSGMTMPYTPKLRAKNRTRPTHVKSMAELEEEELARIRANPIKRHILNPKVITEQGLMGVPKKDHHPPTKPHTPKLATKERGETWGGNKDGDSENETHAHFKAQPLPKGLFDKVSGLPERLPLPLTCAESPEFALKRRKLHRGEEEEEKCQIVIAQPMPDFSRKFEPQLTHKKTEPEPFAFEERYKDKPTRATLVQQILEKERREPFKANPIPDFDGPILPPVQLQSVTQPKTPNLHTKSRGKDHEIKWRQTLDELERKAKKNAEFQAKDAKVLYKPPFVAAKADRPLTEVSNVLLHTEIRSEQRAKFDLEREHNEQLREQEARERQAMIESEEARKVALLRRSLVHKALPIRRHAPTAVLPSSKPLTAPHSPNFHLRLRGVH